MDPASYKQTVTRRGYSYNYYLKGFDAESKLTPLLFLHGFPSTSQDWIFQVQYFTGKGYPVIVPDLLGYGGTSNPDDVVAYNTAPMVADIIDVLDSENISKCIAIGHDWGTFICSRMINLHPERLQAVAFLSVGYAPPQPNFDYEKYLALMKELTGSELFGYWEFFSSSDGPRLCEENIESFYSLLFPQDPKVWAESLAPRGKTREWIENDKRGPTASFWGETELRKHQEQLKQGGLQGPCNWYAARMLGNNNEDEAKVPQDKYTIPVPTLLCTTTRDEVCLSASMKRGTAAFAKNLTFKEFEASHWLILEIPDEVNATLDEFIAENQFFR